MENVINAMNSLFENSALYLNGELLSKELLTKTFSDFLTAVTAHEGHNVGLVLHTGSIIFDAVAVTFAAVSNLVSDSFDSDDVILSLESGDYVVYVEKSGKQERYMFCGFDTPPRTEGEYILLRQGETNKRWVPKTLWRNIVPYRGESTRTDGRGLRKKNVKRDIFISKVLNVAESKIAGITETSTILVASRERADYIVKGLSFAVDGVVIPLLDVVTASYFTENDEYQYSGNAGKNDPVIKITGKASVAGRLVRSKEGNRALGLIVLGNDMILRNYTELPELVNRKSIEYVFLMTHIDSEFGPKMAEDYDDAILFACTKEFLLSNSMPSKVENPYTVELSEQIDAIVDRTVETRNIESLFSWDEYKSFRRAIGAIKSSEYSSDDRDQFIIQAYSLMKLFQTTVFCLNDLEKLIEDGFVDIVAPSVKIEELRNIQNSFPEHLKAHANTVIDTLENGYLKLSEAAPKGEVLRDIVWENRNKKVAIIVPKAYYIVALRKIEELNPQLVRVFCDENLYISTANKFDNTKLFDVLISVGNFTSRKFDVFRCRSAKSIITLLYDYEARLFHFQEKKAALTERSLDKRAYITRDTVDDLDDSIYDESYDSDAAEMTVMDEEIDEYITKINAIAGLKTLGLSVSSGSANADIVAIASFESGEKALFTKLYKAYVFDEITGEVTETEVDKLTEGDSIVFTQNNDKTHDIVDELLGRLIESKHLSDDIGNQFRMSKHWKETLVNYMNSTESTPKMVASRLIANGVSVTEITIRTWLDLDAHTVGPRKKDSLLQIATLAEDEDMFERVDDYFEACNTIRRIRREILREIGKAIISKLNGDIPQEGTLMASVYDRIDSVTKILRLETISFVSRSVPANATNRPLVFKEN